MPGPIPEAGTQALVGGGALGLIPGLTLPALNSTPQANTSFQTLDLIVISFLYSRLRCCVLRATSGGPML